MHSTHSSLSDLVVAIAIVTGGCITAGSCGGRNFRFRVVVTKIVETLRPPPEGGAHLGHVFRGQLTE